MQHMKFIAWNKRKIWKTKQYEITPTLLPHNILGYRCSYVFNSVHEHLAMTDTWKCHIKQVWNMKLHRIRSQLHRITTKKTFCSYSYISVAHFTASTIWGLQKLGQLEWWVTTTHVPNFNMFLTLLKFEWGCFNWLKFDLGCCNLPKYL